MKKNKIKILTLNIHKGLSAYKLEPTLKKIKSNIMETGANIVCLQEVMGGYTDQAVRGQFEVLSDIIWPHYVYGRNAVSSSGHHGNAILSQVPLKRAYNFDITSYSLEKRGILYAVFGALKKNLPNLHVMTLHLDLMAWSRKLQVERLCTLIERNVPQAAPLVVCGDFNDWQEKISDILEKRIGLKEIFFAETGSHAKTFPAILPRLKLDRIYIRDLKVDFVVRLSNSRWRNVSDHLPIYAELYY